MLFKKKDKEEKPEFVQALDNTPARNYEVYKMKPSEVLIYFLIAFAIGAAVGYLFYGGLGKNEYGEATTKTHVLNIIICSVAGLISAKLFIPSRRKSIIEKRRNELKRQFRVLLDTLTTSIGSGKNVHDSFVSAYDDLGIIYSEDDYIMEELQIIRRGLANSIVIEDLLNDFGERSGIDDIKSFAGVFETCSRRGGNMKDIIHSIQQILGDKMNVEENIVTVLASSAMEQKIMLVMPVMIIALVKFSDEDFGSKFATSSGIVATTVGVVCFAVSYIIGKSIMKIKV
ncbi:MAG: hypothetical protein K6G24_03055 [Lachnospiraceae bacterium]|nr:hypothetical protein [Lachnospiraceae bacterium]